MKTSYAQYKKIVEYMEEHGDLLKFGNGPGAHLNKQEKWRHLSNLLNSDGNGDSKTEKKWRKVWSDMKNNAKKKLSAFNRHASRTGGKPARCVPLSSLEKRILKFIGVQADVGMPVEDAVLRKEKEDQAPIMKQLSASQVESNISIDWNIPGTNSQDEEHPTLVWSPSSTPTPPADAERDHQWQPVPKKRKESDVTHLFVESDTFREYVRERDRENSRLENERLRLRYEELRLRDFELHERVRQRDAELQLQVQWLELIKKCAGIVEKYFESKKNV